MQYINNCFGKRPLCRPICSLTSWNISLVPTPTIFSFWAFIAFWLVYCSGVVIHISFAIFWGLPLFFLIALPKKFCIASILANVKQPLPLKPFPSASFLPKKVKDKDKKYNDRACANWKYKISDWPLNDLENSFFKGFSV